MKGDLTGFLHEEGVFYMCPVEIDELLNVDNQTLLQVDKIYVHGIDYCDCSEIEITRENILFQSLRSFVGDIEREIYPKALLEFNINFTNGNRLHFYTGEVSLVIKDYEELETFVISILKLKKFKNTNLLHSLKGFENKYLTIYPDEDFDFTVKNYQKIDSNSDGAPPF